MTSCPQNTELLRFLLLKTRGLTHQHSTLRIKTEKLTSSRMAQQSERRTRPKAGNFGRPIPEGTREKKRPHIRSITQPLELLCQGSAAQSVHSKLWGWGEALRGGECDAVHRVLCLIFGQGRVRGVVVQLHTNYHTESRYGSVSWSCQRNIFLTR